jgi:ABC-2 type transport system permease protein
VSVQAVGALLRASWFQARSYRMSLVTQVFGLIITVIPLYFVANALDPSMAQAIEGEADQFFGFVLVGSVGFMLATAALTTLQGAVSGGIANGYFESLMMTRASLPSILLGLTSYGMVLTVVRATVFLTAGWVLGANLAWSKLLPALVVMVLIVVAHLGIGLVAAALVIAFRTSAGITTFATTISIFFGGVYYPVSEIPSWLAMIAKATPISYGLISLRRVLIHGQSLAEVGSELSVLAAMGVFSLAVGSIAIDLALRYARKAGSLGAY